MNTTEATVPNLDCYASADDLNEFARQLHSRALWSAPVSRAAAAKLFPARPHRYVTATALLAAYANNKATGAWQGRHCEDCTPTPPFVRGDGPCDCDCHDQTA